MDRKQYIIWQTSFPFAVLLSVRLAHCSRKYGGGCVGKPDCVRGFDGYGGSCPGIPNETALVAGKAGGGSGYKSQHSQSD